MKTEAKGTRAQNAEPTAEDHDSFLTTDRY